ncbi:MAG: sugar phosphate isomerase/epimerase family protein [Anaerolineae bacterium]
MTSFTLGINTGFATNRFPEPETWARIVAGELGLASVQLVADLLNPFWPQEVIEAEVARVQQATARYGVGIHSLMTSTFTRVNHLLYPYPELRYAYSEWFKRFADLAVRLGARAVGSHFGILSVRDANDPVRRGERLAEATELWQGLSHHARAIGLEFIYFETMSIPRELGNTIACTRELLAQVNADAGVPMYLCLDMGHAPHPDERDACLWARALGAQARIVHLHQTEADHSRHWPFTPEYNAVGIVEPASILQSLVDGGAEDIFLAFEIAHRESHEQDDRVVPDLKASAAYWRQFVPQDGPWTPPPASRG